jgi:hypothetical protein
MKDQKQVEKKQEEQKTMIHPFQKLCAIAFLNTLVLTGCTTSFTPAIILQPKASSSTTPINTPTSSNSRIIISQVNINGVGSTTKTNTPATTPSASPSPGAGPAYLTTIFFDTVQSQNTINTHCSTSSTGTASQKPCFCQFTWGDLTTTNNSTSSLPRKVQTPLVSIQPNLLTCKAPAVWSSEIIDGTKITITVVPSPLNPDAGTFSVSKYSYTKTTKATSGSFQDISGNIFDNIHHYSCYQKFIRGMQIVSKKTSITNTKDSQAYTAYFSSRFCLALANSPGASQSDCSSSTNPDYSAQSYYFNLYIRNSERGDINLFNSNYICPRVNENLSPSYTGRSSGQVWPLDSTFALSIGPTSTFVLGVEANTKLGSNNDPVIQSNSCFPAEGENAANQNQDASGSIIKSCLGFAAKPNADGTCPYIQDSNQQVVPTYRLRRFFAIYPRVYDTDGKPLSGQNQSVDTVYVLDRPVDSTLNSDLTRPYTMMGPKPCPFAFFDRKGVTRSPSPTPSPYPAISPYPIAPGGYVSTSDPRWDDVNIDGIEFPNIDGKDEDGVIQCSATLPFLTTNESNIRQYVLRTINRYNLPVQIRHAYIRPIKSFIPHYEEDQNFLACAPQAKPLKDPPLHFVRDQHSGNVAWCAESYPTQNPNVSEFDPRGTGVTPFTSHTVYNSSSRTCAASPISSYPSPYPTDTSAGKIGRHSNSPEWDHNHGANLTCDRTVTQNIIPSVNGSIVSGSSDWPRFPLLAHAQSIEDSIAKDKSYFCTITYDGGGEKVGRTTPSSGCCSASSVQVPTIPLSGVAPNPNPAPTNNAGHLEPDVGCYNPKY